MITALQAEALTKKIFGISCEAVSLPGEHDVNFHLRSQEGCQFLLKISQPEERESVLGMQQATLQHIQAHSVTFYSPEIQRTRAGEWLDVYHSPAGTAHLVRLFSYKPGKLFGEVNDHSADLLHHLGEQVGHLTVALTTFQHPEAKRALKWDLKQADWIRTELHSIDNAENRNCVDYFLQKFSTDTAPILPHLRQSIIHGDINHYNIVLANDPYAHQISGFIDFGDVVETATICELAIATAYAMLDKPDPLAAAAHVIKGFHRIYPLQELEISVIFDLICIRLCMSVVNSAVRKKENPNDAYLTISEKSAWVLLKKMQTVHPRFAFYTFRDACDLPPCPQTPILTTWLQSQQNTFASLLLPDVRTAPKYIFDLSPGSLETDHFNEMVENQRKKGISLAIGQYAEPRIIYSTPAYQLEGNDGGETRTIHLGLDLFKEPGAPVYAPLDGIVHSVADNHHLQDYGPTVILRHVISDIHLTFYTLYGHLNRDSLTKLTPNQCISKGSIIGWIGETEVNGGWIPHLHFQIITDLLYYEGNFPGVAQASKKSIWLSISPDPNLMTCIPINEFPQKKSEPADILQMREEHISKNVKLSYRHPLHIVRGIGQYLYDEEGRQYLDCVNNVCHVGHCHPAVVRAGQKQMALLNTNTRYLHENLAHYAQRLIATLPAPLEIGFFVSSGSEANELALRLAQHHTGRKEFLVMDHAYHGNTSTLIHISPYKFNGVGGKGKPDFVHVLPTPDLLRKKTTLDLSLITKNLAAFIAEPLLSCGGQVVLPDHYLQTVYAAVRSAGGLCIADEVQIGLGRVGSHFWGFETQGIVPDIVTLGKPLGNGHPIGAVVTTREIADSFCNGMEYFNTFGGNTVSCAIGVAVLDVLESENLQAHAHAVGQHLKQKLNALKDKYTCIGDVRGLGLFLGIEFVTDRESLTPAKDLTAFVVNRMKERGVLLSADGPYQNVIKIKPPMVISEADCDYLVATLDAVLTFHR